MKFSKPVQLFALSALVLMMAVSATALFAGHDTPPDARNFQCTTVTLAPGQSQTVAIPYSSKDYYLKMMLEGAGADGVKMEVFTSEQNAKGTGPVGLGTFNKFEPAHSKVWEGRFLFSDIIYVRLTNTTNAPVTVRLCSYERLWFPPPTPIPPTPVPRIELPPDEDGES